MNGKYVNEQTHQKGKKFFKKAALIAGLIALTLIIAGIIVIVNGVNKPVPDMLQDGWFEAESDRNQAIFSGAALIGVALIPGVIAISMLVVAHQREILAFGASTVAPVAGETINYLADETSPAIEKVVGAVSSGVAEGVVKAKSATGANQNNNVKYCQECGTKNPKSAKFCSNCGKKFE